MRVKFFCEKHLLGAIPNPVPSIKMAPDYFKAVKPQSNPHPESGTVKRCVPFLDALSAGYVIPMWCDVYVFARNDEITIDFPQNFAQSNTLGTHSADQIPNHPLSKKTFGNMPLKWSNPWVIETDPGVSCLFTSPLNHLETRFKILDGVVDTDNYYNNVNFPFLWTGGHGEFFIPKGTPLVQVIPFRREDQELEVSSIDQDKRTEVLSTLGTKMKNAYREEFWSGTKKKSEAFVEPVKEEPEADISAEEPVVSSVSVDPVEPLILADPIVEAEPEKTKADILAENGYVILRGVISSEEANEYSQRVFDASLDDSRVSTGDSLCSNAKNMYAYFDDLLEKLTPAIAKASGKNLLPTYSFARLYKTGDDLPIHDDRPSCQYSITLCLGMSGAPWPIYMSKPADENNGIPITSKNGQTHFIEKKSAANLEVTDAVLYRGCDMLHWREPLEGEWQTQVFLHWVDADGEYASYVYDGRPGLHHQIDESKNNISVDDLTSASDLKEGSSSGILEIVVDNDSRGFGEGSF